jgi:predicted dehydrogenase
VTAICGSEKARAVAQQWGIPHVFTGYDWAALAASPEVDVVHINSPNRQHFAQAKAALAAGKHVICEKPLAMNTAETAELAALAKQHPAQVFAVNYNVRFYPAVLQLRADVAAGRLGQIIHVNGSYMQDWLLKPTDYNWRLVAEEGGDLRAVGDIGTHWLDTACFVLGTRIEAVFAQLCTFHQTRQRPVGEVQTFSSEAAAETVSYPVNTEDFANVLLRFSGGPLGNVAVSQVAAGRKNSIRLEIYGTEGSACWHSEEPNFIHYGSRDGSNRESQRGCPGFSDANGFTDYPPGHAEGFPDTFKMLYRAVYADIASGKSAAPLYATAEDGHDEVALCDAILRSHRTQQWPRV